MIGGGEGAETGGGRLGVAGVIGGERKELQHGRLPRVGQQHDVRVAATSHRRQGRVTPRSRLRHIPVNATSRPLHEEE